MALFCTLFCIPDTVLSYLLDCFLQTFSKFAPIARRVGEVTITIYTCAGGKPPAPLPAHTASRSHARHTTRQAADFARFSHPMQGAEAPYACVRRFGSALAYACTLPKAGRMQSFQDVSGKDIGGSSHARVPKELMGREVGQSVGLPRGAPRAAPRGFHPARMEGFQP